MTSEDKSITLTLRTRQSQLAEAHSWLTVEQTARWKAHATAIIIVDMWDRHWSRGATQRVNLLAPQIDRVIAAARQQGILIIHAPSDVVAAYADHPARRTALAAPHTPLPPVPARNDPPLPIDDSDGGSDTGETSWYTAWTCQHDTIMIDPSDAISDSDQEIFNLLRHREIQHIIYMGVHLNMCVLNRPFGIKRMKGWGFNLALARDLTDTMYNPLRAPYVSHAAGTELVVNYVESFWCPTFHSSELLASNSIM